MSHLQQQHGMQELTRRCPQLRTPIWLVVPKPSLRAEVVPKMTISIGVQYSPDISRPVKIILVPTTGAVATPTARPD